MLAVGMKLKILSRALLITILSMVFSNEHHDLLKNYNWPEVKKCFIWVFEFRFAPSKKYKELMISVDDCLIIGSQRKLKHTHTHILVSVGHTRQL